MDLGLIRPSNLHFKIMEKVLMVLGDVDICRRPAPLTPIIQASLLYCWVFLFVVMREVGIGLRQATLLHITMVDYTLYNQGSLKNIFPKDA